MSSLTALDSQQRLDPNFCVRGTHRGEEKNKSCRKTRLSLTLPQNASPLIALQPWMGLHLVFFLYIPPWKKRNEKKEQLEILITALYGQAGARILLESHDQIHQISVEKKTFVTKAISASSISCDRLESRFTQWARQQWQTPNIED